MSGKRDVLQLLVVAQEHGFVVRLTRGGHYQVRDAGGRYVCTAGASTSDSRAHLALRAALRRAGLPR